MDTTTHLQRVRAQFKPNLPKKLKEHLSALAPVPEASLRISGDASGKVRGLFPETYGQMPVAFTSNHGEKAHRPLRVGVVLSGGQAAGGHNVIGGLFDALSKLNSASRLFGFLNGPGGIIDNKWRDITAEALAPYRNQGGFDLIGSGRTKIETPEQFQAAEAAVRGLQLDGLVIIGGDDSNTNAALLAEFFRQRQMPISVVGVPKTIDGDLKDENIEVSFGFDTACKVYSEIIGNLMRDSLSAKKYYFFVKLMGRSASHIALECALQTHPNFTLIGEEIASQHKTIQQVTEDLCDVICQRADAKKNYGVILIPEGVIEFIPEFKAMIKALNTLLATGSDAQQLLEEITSKQDKVKHIGQQLKGEAQACFHSLPEDIQLQLLLDRDPHGNVQVSKIDTERLFIELVRAELAKRKVAGRYSGKFDPQPLFCGYEGRSGLPTNFDAQYCYALGHVAALLVDGGTTGYISCIKNLTGDVNLWEGAGIPITSMLTIEERHGKDKPVIRKALVDLQGKPFKSFQEQRTRWQTEDAFLFPGPIQFFGPPEVTDSVPLTLRLEKTV